MVGDIAIRAEYFGSTCMHNTARSASGFLNAVAVFRLSFICQIRILLVGGCCVTLTSGRGLSIFLPCRYKPTSNDNWLRGMHLARHLCIPAETGLYRMVARPSTSTSHSKTSFRHIDSRCVSVGLAGRRSSDGTHPAAMNWCIVYIWQGFSRSCFGATFM